MDFFSFFKKKQQPASGSVAKDRLKLVLVHDRVNCSSQVLEMLKTDIIKVISNYYCAKKGFGDTISHPGNIIPPVLNADEAHPEWNNVQLKDYDAFFGNSNVQTIIAMAGVESDYKVLLTKV